MGEWITHRRPTEDEIGDSDYTMGSEDGRVFVVSGSTLRQEQYSHFAWMPRPEPYQPPEPDTSLSASIERVKAFDNEGNYSYNPSHGVCLSDDLDRIIEAAKKWNLKQQDNIDRGAS
jgi:hypothetical protein